MTNELFGVVERAEAMLEGATAVLTPAGAEALRRQLPAAWQQHYAFVVDLVLGTRKARDLGKASEGFLYTTVMAEQATHPRIARWHAAPFKGCNYVVEACTGAGVDAAALAAVAKRVVTFEANALHATVAEANLQRAGCTNVTVVSGGVPSVDWEKAVAMADGLWADPSRRTQGGRRTRQAAEYNPPLDVLLEGLAPDAVAGVKVGPADVVGASIETTMDSTWVGFRGEARERTLWRNANGRGGQRIYLADADVEWEVPLLKEVPTTRRAVGGDVIVEPHNAIIASGHVGAWFAEAGFDVIDVRIGYGIATADPGPSPWYQRWVICEVESGIDRKRIQHTIGRLGWGSETVIKKRGVDIDPMELHRRLRFSQGGPAGAVLLARTDAGRCTIYAQRPA